MITKMRREIVIDRLAVEFRISSPTQAWRVRERLGGGATYVDGLGDEGSPFPPDRKNTPTTKFRATFQDPSSARAVLTALKGCALTENPRLVMLEVALDVYAPGADAQQLSHIVVDLYRYLDAQPASDWHVYRKRKGGLVGSYDVADRRTLTRLLADGWQLTDTRDKKAAPKRLHAYVKTCDYDVQLGVSARLQTDQWRARLEVTLQGAELPTDDAGTLESLDLSKLADHFRFRRLSDDLHPAARYALETVSVQQHGREGSYKRKHLTKVGVYSGQRTKYRTSTKADSTMNEAVRVALRSLERGWRSTAMTPRRKPANKNFRTTSLSTRKAPVTEKTPATPGERVLWEYGGPSHKLSGSNYREELSIDIEALSDGSTSIQVQEQGCSLRYRSVSNPAKSPSSAQELRCSSWSTGPTHADQDASEA